MTNLERELRALVSTSAGRNAGHLDLAVAATKLADLATRIARSEVIEARDEGSTWSDVADAFGVSTQTAHERFRSGPDGLHSRFDRLQSKSDGARSGRTTSTGVDSAARTKRSTRS